MGAKKEGTMQVSNEITKHVGSDADYDAFLVRVNDRFNGKLAGVLPLLTTDATGLWEAYLGGFTDDFRQHNNCHACRNFIERFGGLVLCCIDGKTTSAIWDVDDAPEAYKASVAAVLKIVGRAKVTGVFLSTERVLGTPITGPWHHLSVALPEALVMRRGLLTAGQVMAEKREDFGQVMRALDEFKMWMVAQALTILRADALYRSEKVLGQAEWLHRLHEAIAPLKGSRRTNMVWHEVAKAPAGFCHPRASMIGTLLEDLAADMDFDVVRERFAKKMHPLAYQRPQAAPTSGAVAQAEKVFEKMGLAPALARRFCRLDEVVALWRPKEAAKPSAGGVFGHLTTKDAGKQTITQLLVPEQPITWAKFRAQVLPTAEAIEAFVGYGNQHFLVLVTAVNPEAPPLLQWDRDDQRNPVSAYCWNGGVPASQFGLQAGEWAKVNAVTLRPHQWHDERGLPHQSKGVLFVLDGATETRNGGLTLFPETLRAELHGVRSVIEAFSRTGTIEGMGQPHAAGLEATDRLSVRVRVKVCGQLFGYKIDRME